jgi:hypothetical protein
MMTSERSSFVTVLAWVFIVLSGVGTAISALQNVMVYFVFPRAQLRAAMETDPASTQLPAFAKFMLGNIEVFVAAMLLLSLLALVASIGLLKRQNWARLVLIGLLGFGIAWNLGGLVLQQAITSQFPEPTNVPAEFQGQFQAMRTVFLVVAVVFSIGVSAVFGWIIWRLRSASVVAEFRVSVSA